MFKKLVAVEIRVKFKVFPNKNVCTLFDKISTVIIFSKDK